MKQYDITVTRFGFATIEAESEKEAMEIAEKMETDDFDWSDDIEVTDCQEVDIKDLYDLYTIEYVKENDIYYGRCETCKHYGKCIVCGDCDDGSEYKFDLIYYQREHDSEITEWIKENKIDN